MSKHHQATGHIQSFNNYNSFNNTINLITKTDPEGHDILEWLSPLEPQLRHESVRADRLGGVGNWILETKEFRRWSGTEGGCVEPVLFCYGNPGVGKTYLRYKGFLSGEGKRRCH